MGENLYKKVKNKLDNVNPIVNYNDVLDNNGESIKDKFNKLNHIFLDFKDNSVAKTRLQLPIERRRKGLYVSYVNSNGTPITEQYIGEDCTDSYFALNKNWSRLDSIKTDSNGKILSSYLPSYVDDVREYDSLDGFPEIGESGKIYVTLDTDLTYRWSGSKYTEISKSLALGETETTAFPGNRGVKLESDILNINDNINTINADLEYSKVFQVFPLLIVTTETEADIEHNRLVLSKIKEDKSQCWVRITINGKTYIHAGLIRLRGDDFLVVYSYDLKEYTSNKDYVRTLDPFGYGYIFKKDGTVQSQSSLYNDTKIAYITSIRKIFCNRGNVLFNIESGTDSSIFFTLYQNDLVYHSDRWKDFSDGIGYSDYTGYLYEAAKMSRPQICSNGTSIGAIFPSGEVRGENSTIALFNITEDYDIQATFKKFHYGEDGTSESFIQKKYTLATKDDLDTAMTIRSLDIEDEE